MTDIYGTEPHDHEAGHDEVLTHEHESVREAPSDYEFSDDHGGATTEEQADEHVTLADVASESRSPFLPIAAAVAGVILLGGVAWWQFGGSKPSAPPPAASATMAPIPVSASADANNESIPVSTVAAKSNAASMGDTDNTASSSAPPSAVAPMPVLSAPVPQAAPVAAPIAVAPAAPVAAPVSFTPPASAPISGNDPHAAALNVRMDELQKSIEQTSQQVNQIATMVAASANNAANSDSANRATEERLDKIEQQLAQLRHPAPVLAAPSPLPADMPVTPLAPANPKPVAASAHKKTRIAAEAAATSAPAAAARHHARHSAAKEPPAPVWVLRAAAPGQAWVSPDATSHDLTQLHVGDTLNGIGRVTAIQQQDGNWVVQGTKGSIP